MQAPPLPPLPPSDSGGDARALLKQGIKRKRLVLSCLECKRRKLKCDRELPICRRCQDAGQASRCKYDERLAFGDGDHDSHASESSSAARPSVVIEPGQPLNIHERQRLELLERHVASLESRLNIQPGASQSALALTPPTSSKAVTPDNHVSVVEISNDPEEPMVMRGKRFKTQFYGASHSVSIISYFDEVHDFLKKTTREHPMFNNHKMQHRVRKNAERSERSQKKEKYKFVCIPPDQIDQHLLDALPDQPTCRRWMELYFKHFEGLYRILHRLVFWRNFERFWAGQLEDAPLFNALLLVAMSCARCLFPDSPLSFENDSTTSRLQAAFWVQAAETWHTYQSKKHTSLEIFQISALILLSKRVNAIKLKQHYAIAQSLLATAISSGLHRSPYLLGPRSTLYDREMRRRIWSVFAEQELVCCNGRGMPSTMGNIFSDCEAPQNLRDDDFDDTTDALPTAVPDTTFTELSYVRWLHDVRSLRMTINALVNHPQKHHVLPYSELLSYHTQIANRLQSPPQWTLASAADAEPHWLFSQMVQLNLHHLLIILHLPFAADRAGGPSAAHSRFICNESARATLAVYEQLPAHGFSGLCITRHHIVRAGLCICLLQDATAAAAPLTAPLLHAQSTGLLERAFSLIEDRILCLGSGLRGYWLLFAASCFLKSHGTTPDACADWQRKIQDRIVAIFGKICLSQTRADAPGFTMADAAETAELYRRHIQRAGQMIRGEEEGEARWGAGREEASVAAAVEGAAGGEVGVGEAGMEGWGVALNEVDWADWTLDDFGFYSLGDA